jgi:hypothetical protein
MQTTILDISNSNVRQEQNLDITLSFNGFIQYMQQRVADEKTMKHNLFEFVLNKFLNNPNIKDELQVEDMEQFKEELELIYTVMQPPISNEQETVWALCKPLTPVIFYGTDALYKFLVNETDQCLKCSFTQSISDEEMLKNKMKHVYAFIFEKFYHFTTISKPSMVYSIVDDATKLTKYFSVEIDTRFVEVTAKQPLPNFDINTLAHHADSNELDWENIPKQLPLSMFSFKGFSIISIKDVTAEQAMENIKSFILHRHGNGDYHNKVVEALKTLTNSADIGFGMLPVIRVNDQLVITDESSQYSVMLDAIVNKGNAKEFLVLTENYLSQPRVILYDVVPTNGQNVYMDYLLQAGVVTYALVPIYYNNHVAGILEVYTRKKGALNLDLLSKLEPTIPLLAQLMQNAIDDFDMQVENVIKEKFTSLQPSVQWKFNEVAWQYIHNNRLPNSKKPIDNIVFKNVHPLYGAVDIRNSTIERNEALVADFRYLLKLLQSILGAIKQKVGIALADEMIFKCNKWLNGIGDMLVDDDHLRINDFLEQDIAPFLQHFREEAGLEPIINQYFNAIDEEKGEAFHNRRVLENSMQTINNAINQYLEMFRDEIQNSYPCYFEKFRTDGVEYDIYIGQSIVPAKPFNQLYLKNIRLWQLSSMAAIAKITHALLPQLPRELHTTQLIFVRSATIDIGFRNDERKFDVEGTYNIRYQIIKKRIDKVHVKNTRERLTQPGKIALVYFNKREAEEYREYISYLQEQGMLENDLEHLELEDLQGVSGLKALRVGVVVQ